MKTFPTNYWYIPVLRPSFQRTNQTFVGEGKGKTGKTHCGEAGKIHPGASILQKFMRFSWVPFPYETFSTRDAFKHFKMFLDILKLKYSKRFCLSLEERQWQLSVVRAIASLPTGLTMAPSKDRLRNKLMAVWVPSKLSMPVAINHQNESANRRGTNFPISDSNHDGMGNVMAPKTQHNRCYFLNIIWKKGTESFGH